MREVLNNWGKEKIPFIFLIDFECKKPLCWKLDDPNSAFKINFQGVKNYPTQSHVPTTSKVQLIKHPISFEAYKLQFDEVMSNLSYGNSFLVNLTCSTPIETGLSLEEIFYGVHSKYSCWLQNEFVCFSPETFISIRDGHIHSYPMKGTIDASIKNARDILLNDCKEIAEHATIVDLIRNDLSLIAENVRVTKFRYYEELKTQTGMIGQISSEITGTLPTNYQEQIGDILFKLLPAGSISGAPKQKTVDIIKKIEQDERGYYTGVAGYFDGENLDSCVLIRYIEESGRYRSGGGITFQSNLADEYKEMINKIYVPIF
ncbi:MAG: aminodeoxychorismate synthase component I [Bacteroidota bacterium]